jgi:hypothetical protein
LEAKGAASILEQEPASAAQNLAKKYQVLEIKYTLLKHTTNNVNCGEQL